MARTTKEDDDGVINVLQSIIQQNFPNPNQIGHTWVTGAIEHIQKMRKEINALKRS